MGSSVPSKRQTPGHMNESRGGEERESNIRHFDCYFAGSVNSHWEDGTMELRAGVAYNTGQVFANPSGFRTRIRILLI